MTSPEHKLNPKLVILILAVVCVSLIIIVVILVSRLAQTLSGNPQSSQTAQATDGSTSNSLETVSSQTTSERGTSTFPAAVGSKSNSLPLGDGLYATSAKKGYIFACNTNFNGGGAFNAGDWINTASKTWNPNQKATVDGDVHWSNASFKITINGTTRTITGNDLPISHNTGIFPIKTSDDAYAFDRNPNSIQVQSYTINFATNPQLAATPHCIGGEVGVTLSGVAVFNGFDAAGRDAVAHEVQDKCDGHPQSAGEYHYHGLSDCLDATEDTAGNAKLVGYALDGFGIFGNIENGKRLSTNDLDECHGHTGQVMWDGKLVTMYHYHATDDFPYTVGCFKGTPVRMQLIPGVMENGGGMMPPPK